MTTKWLVAIGLFVVVFGIAAVACSDDPSEEELFATLCGDLDALRAADAAFDALDENGTLDEIRSVNSDFNVALNDALDSAGDLAGVRTESIEAAYNDLAQAISGISGEMTIPEALLSIENELVAIDTAYATAFSGVDC